MAKKMLIDATHSEETRVVVVDGNKVEEFDFESENKRQLAGNIYLAKVTRVEPSLQAAFVDYGGNRHGFLAFSEIHPDYYQIPVADREALMEEERAYAESLKAREEEEERRPSRSRRKSRAHKLRSDDALESAEPQIAGMETIDLSDQDDTDESGVVGEDAPEGMSPMETVGETPVEEPSDKAPEADDSGAGGEAEVESAVAVDPDSTTETATETETGPAMDPETVAATPAESSGPPDAGPPTDRDRQAEIAQDAAEETHDDDETPQSIDAASKDSNIESVADEDDVLDLRPVRKPRPRRYKIQEVVKVRQILLVQVVKEERGNKGAALTTYLSLAGRYCVLMPNTARGGGISRKITNAVDRKKLKNIASEIDVPAGAGLIVRTAGAKRTKAEIKRDYEYLQRLWEQIRELTLKSIAPAKIYEEGDLIKRSIRDLYNREIDEVFVEGERGYRIAKDFMKMIMPSHAKNVKQYSESMPLFARYQVETYLGGMFNPTVQLKSGGYIVIGVTEALVAIDVNSGRATKENSIEETATKTNLEAAEEVARQLRLRDLAGLIVIDFIDMDERKNNAAVEKRIKDRLKSDRARIQVGRISGFGLMEMSRQRLRPGMIEATTQPCPACHGTGLIRSDDNMSLSILRQIEEEGTRRRSREVLVRAPVSIANFLMNAKREHIAQIELRYGLSVRVEGDVHLVSPDFTLEKFKTATRVVPVASAAVVSVDTSLMEQIDADDTSPEAQEAPAPEATDGEGKPKRKRRRRRRRSGKSGVVPESTAEASAESAPDPVAAAPAADPSDTRNPAKPEGTDADAADAAGGDDKPKPTRSRSRSSSTRSKSVRGKTPDPEEAADAADEAAPEVEAAADKPKPKRRRTRKPPAEKVVEPDPGPEPDKAVVASDTNGQAAAPVAATVPDPIPEPAPEVAGEQPPKPKRRGWWSLGK